MANRFWVGDGGNWSDNLNHWSASSGGAPNASLPTTVDNVYFDANSFTIGAQTVNVDATAYCLAMDWTGATNTPTWGTPGYHTQVYGNVTFIAAMIIPSAGEAAIDFRNTGAVTFTTNGVSIGRYIAKTGGTGSITLQDNLICTQTNSSAFYLQLGNFITGNNNMTISGGIRMAAATTFTLGSSIISCSVWNMGAGITIPANTATINVSGTGAFAGGGIATYHNVNLIGTAHTVSGSNTFNSLNLPAGTTQTITFTDGTTQTITTPVLSGSSGHIHTLTGSGAAGWAMIIGSISQVHYCTVDHSTVSGAVYYALTSESNVDGGSNSGWTWTGSSWSPASSIKQFIPAHLRDMFYNHPMPKYKYAVHDGYAPYSFPTDGLVLYLPLWALKGSPIKSVDAYKHTGTVTGALWSPQGRYFDGDDYISTDNDSSITTKFSIIAWIKAGANVTAYRTITAKSSTPWGAGSIQFLIELTTGVLFFTSENNGLNTTGVTAVNDDTWHCVAGVCEGNPGNGIIYIDGAVDKSTATTANPASAALPFYIGARDAAPAIPYIGVVGEVLWYNRVLTLAEILHNYNATKWRYS